MFLGDAKNPYLLPPVSKFCGLLSAVPKYPIPR